MDDLMRGTGPQVLAEFFEKLAQDAFEYADKPYEAWIVFPETPDGKLSISLSPIGS